MSRKGLALTAALALGCGLLTGEGIAFAGLKPTGSLKVSRVGHMAVLLPSGKVLVAGGRSSGEPIRETEIFDPAEGEWSASAPLVAARSQATATLLPSGKVLIAGGAGGERSGPLVPLASAEVFDPSTESWEPAGALASPRYGHTATLLPSGEVLVTGGGGPGQVLAGAELYDPSSGQWRPVPWAPAGGAPLARMNHTATLLPTGEVLVAGGRTSVSNPPSPSDPFTSNVEIYRPDAEAWTFRAAAPLQLPRYQHTATLLYSGEVLFAGGSQGEIYDPRGPTASQLVPGSLEDRRGHVAALLPSGKVLIHGGMLGFAPCCSTNSTLLFDPVTRSWSFPAFATPKVYRTATLLPSGRVLLAGGWIWGLSGAPDTFEAEIYEPEATASWEVLVPPADAGVKFGPLALLGNGKLLVLTQSGGSPAAYLFDESSANARWQRTGNPRTSRQSGLLPQATATVLPSGEVLVLGGGSDSVEIYDPATGSWRDAAPLGVARKNPTATLLSSGKVLVVGGKDSPGSAEVYDPALDAWQATGALITPREEHAAALLPDGRVLVVGGRFAASSAEIYDPETGAWEPTGELIELRRPSTAILLPSGKVLARGDQDSRLTPVAEVFDPATGTWSPAGSPLIQAVGQTATLLTSGKVLFAGGIGAHLPFPDEGAELYDPATNTWEGTAAGFWLQEAVLLPSGRVFGGSGDFDNTGFQMEIYTPEPSPAAPRPTITRATGVIRYGETLEIEGTGFGGLSEASGGGTQSSSANFPLIRLHRLNDGGMWWLSPAPRPNFRDSPMLLQVDELPAGLFPGDYLISVVAAGVASTPVAVQIECSVGDPVLTAEAAPGSARTFRVASQGALFYRWLKDGLPIAGATGDSYTTPPLTGADQGTIYTAEVNSGCLRKSAAATVILPDGTAPQATVVSPHGGEYWLLSTADETRQEPVAWSMSDDIRICRAVARLVYSTDGGTSYTRVAGPPLFEKDNGPACRAAVTDGSFTYTVPVTPPGAPGALYRIEVEVTDYDTDPATNAEPATTPCQSPSRTDGARTTIACSPNPFFIVQSNPDAVRTLILTHSARMEGLFPSTREALATSLRNLANHPRVQGVVIDLANVTGLDSLYAAWDGSQEPEGANDVLFAESGIHDYLDREVFPRFTGVKYLVLVGDDRIVPFARIADETALPESVYVDVFEGDLTSQQTVGKALKADFYLSDDLLAVRSDRPPFSPSQLRQGAFLPDLAVGRLVETPPEVIATISKFISKDGLLDLSALGPAGHKVLITGYDFLLDSGIQIHDRWESALGSAGGGLAPVNGALLSPDWGESSVENRRQVLRQHLAGNGGSPYAVLNLNGHAAHHLEGVPGTGASDIQGLASGELPSFEGTVVYAVGCHGGLPVPGEAPEDHPFDLPQAFLSRGALAYIANTGFGWGLDKGVGYGERLVELFTEEMTAGGTVVVGEAAVRAKLRYFLQIPRRVASGYDEKTLQQWTFFGLPMYAVRTGIGSPPTQGETAQAGRLGPVAVERKVAEREALPRFLTQLNLHFDFSGPGVYTKYDADGHEVLDAGCPNPAGCYYALNGVPGSDTGTGDLPIQPYLVYDSRLSGTSQHGALWMGGTYVEERDWHPLVARLASNGGDFSNHGATPRLVQSPPMPRRRPTGGDAACLPADLDLNSLVVVTGETLEAGEGWRQRVFQDMDIEVLYFNDRGHPDRGNCDDAGPKLGSPTFGESYHRVHGSSVEWAVPASDEAAAVWRVIVIYDQGADAEGRGSWLPLELEAGADGLWRGSLPLPGSQRLTYFLQAVDTRGNVSWLDFTTADLPASGVPLDLLLPVDVSHGKDFFTVAPCRLVDTRQPAGPAGAMPGGLVRTFNAAGACGIPSTAAVIAVNLTVASPTGAGHLQVVTADQGAQPTSVLNFGAGQTRANNALIRLGADGGFSVVAVVPGGSAHLVVDVVGYFE